MSWTRHPFPGEPAGERDRAVVERQIGRAPRGDVAISVRCAYGLPAVVRTAPRLEDGTPFPTLFYLVCPIEQKGAGRAEAAGTMRDIEAALAEQPALASSYRRAHDSYVAQRNTLGVLDPPVSAGGMPDRVKCLHALVAHDLAESNPAGAIARETIEPHGCPGPCVQGAADGTLRRVPGHPGF